MSKIPKKSIDQGIEYDIYLHADCDKKHNHRLTVRKKGDRYQLVKHFFDTKKDEVQYDYPDLDHIAQRATEMHNACYPKEKNTFIVD